MKTSLWEKVVIRAHDVHYLSRPWTWSI